MFAVALIAPADVVVEGMNVGRMAGGQRLAKILLHLGPEILQPHGVDRVLEPGHLAVGAVAKIALHLHDRRGDVEHILRLHKPQPLGQRGECFGGAGRHTHPAAGEHVVAENLSLLVHSQQAEVVGVDIGAVVFRQGEGRFEFARQVSGPVDRLDLLPLGAPAHERLFASVGIGEPDFVIGAGARGEVLGERVGHQLHLFADQIIPDRGGAAHHIAFHVAAGGERGELYLVDPLDRRLEIPFHDAMVLNALSGCQPHGAVGQFVSQIDLGQHLGCGELAARNARPHHKRDLAGALGPLLRLALLAVILLVGAMILEQLNTSLAEAGGAVDEFLGNVAGEIVAGDFGQFDGTRLGGGGLRLVCHAGSSSGVLCGWSSRAAALVAAPRAFPIA